jgi:hypothetical protein
MKLTSPFTVIASRLSRPSPSRSARIALAVVILVGGPHITGAQTAGNVPSADSSRPAIVIESPASEATVRGPAIIVFRTENVRIMSVFVPPAPDASPVRGGHLHVKVDAGEWHWVHSSVDPVVVSGLRPGTHTVRLELADTNHRPLDAQTVTFTIAAPPPH